MALAGVFRGRRSSPFGWLLAGMGTGYVGLILVPIAHMQFRYALLPAETPLVHLDVLAEEFERTSRATVRRRVRRSRSRSVRR